MQVKVPTYTADNLVHMARRILAGLNETLSSECQRY